MKVVGNVEGIAFIHFDEKDVVRHPLVQQIVKAYELTVDPDSKRRRSVTVTDGGGRPVARRRGLARGWLRVAALAALAARSRSRSSPTHASAAQSHYRRKDAPDGRAVIPRRRGTASVAHLGDIVIATGVARRQAREAGIPIGRAADARAPWAAAPARLRS